MVDGRLSKIKTKLVKSHLSWSFEPLGSKTTFAAHKISSNILDLVNFEWAFEPFAKLVKNGWPSEGHND